LGFWVSFLQSVIVLGFFVGVFLRFLDGFSMGSSPNLMTKKRLVESSDYRDFLSSQHFTPLGVNNKSLSRLWP
jgi:hypothetical protein